MTRATSQMRHFAERLIAHDQKGSRPSEPETPAYHASEKLRPHLATLMGETGFRALLSRALALATEEVPWLRGMHVSAQGSLEGWGDIEEKIAPEEVARGRVVLLAQLLGLLVAFIGEELTLQLAREVWPKLPLNDLDVGKWRTR